MTSVVDSTDKGTPGSSCTGTVSGACRIVDLDFDGDYDATDATLFDNLTQGLARHPDRTTTAVAFPFGHQGLWYDAELESCQNRARWYSAALRRFGQKDFLPNIRVHQESVFVRSAPLAYVSPPSGPWGQYRDGMNLFQYVAGNPIGLRDPSGLTRYVCDCTCADGVTGFMWEWYYPWCFPWWTGCCQEACNHACQREDLMDGEIAGLGTWTICMLCVGCP